MCSPINIAMLVTKRKGNRSIKDDNLHEDLSNNRSEKVNAHCCEKQVTSDFAVTKLLICTLVTGGFAFFRRVSAVDTIMSSHITVYAEPTSAVRMGALESYNDIIINCNAPKAGHSRFSPVWLLL